MHFLRFLYLTLVIIFKNFTNSFEGCIIRKFRVMFRAYIITNIPVSALITIEWSAVGSNMVHVKATKKSIALVSAISLTAFIVFLCEYFLPLTASARYPANQFKTLIRITSIMKSPTLEIAVETVTAKKILK